MATRQFVVQLPDGTKRLVTVPLTGTVGAIRVALTPSTGGALSYSGQIVDDATPVARFPALETFVLIPPPPVPPRVTSAVVAAECPICLEPLSLSVASVDLPCRHTFHAVCAREWAQHSAHCPLCRQPMPSVASTVVKVAAPAPS
jgi:hypothetical protein